MWKDDKFEVPADISAKGPEEIGKYYTEHYGERYKDYDDLKGRASQVEAYTKYGKPEEIESKTGMYDRMASALQQGKVIVRGQDGQLYARDMSELTPAEKKEAARTATASGDLDDWLPPDFDDLTPRQQAAAQRKAYQAMLNETVSAKEREFVSALNGAQSGSTQMLDGLMGILAGLQDHPELKLKDVLTRAATLRASGASGDAVKAAFDELLRPAEIQRMAKEEAARIIAEERLKAEKARAEKVMTNQFQSPLQRMIMERASGNQRVSKDQIIANLREKNLLQ